MKLIDYEKYYHNESEFIIPRDEFEKIIEENQRLNNVLNELEKDFEKYDLEYLYDTYQTNLANFIDVELSKIRRLKELKESDK